MKNKNKISMSLKAFGGLIGSVCLASAGVADTAVTVYYKDFDATSPGFEYSTNFDPGVAGPSAMVTGDRNTAGQLTGGKPTWAGPAGVSWPDQAAFDNAWADDNDIEGVLMFDSSTVEVNPGEFKTMLSFYDNSFFPDEVGNTYFFTMWTAGTFNFDLSDSFTFSGDDDFYLYIGGDLVIDLGGVHTILTRTVTGQDLVNWGYSTDTDYEFDIFFAERHTTLSNLGIETTFKFNQPPPVVPEVSTAVSAAGFALLGGFFLLRSRKVAQAK